MDILIYLAEFSIHIFDRLSVGGLEIGRLLYYHKKFLSDNFVKAQRLRVKKGAFTLAYKSVKKTLLLRQCDNIQDQLGFFLRCPRSQGK
jgi:hypothetical protein